ncbi:uncharacterized protein METZ01_LOCUS369834 [marine metagenome]|uniref:Uncharacterized protein n=1 Tax=marine metagenome TaxID=408172 RepID=A0A382T485_9ZZZZ
MGEQLLKKAEPVKLLIINCKSVLK